MAYTACRWGSEQVDPNSLDTKVNAFVFNKLPVTVTVTVTACRWGSEQVNLTVWILELTLLYLINSIKLPVTVTEYSSFGKKDISPALPLEYPDS